MQAKARRPAFLGFCNLRSICCLIIFAIVAAAVIATAQKSEAPKSERGNMLQRHRASLTSASTFTQGVWGLIIVGMSCRGHQLGAQ